MANLDNGITHGLTLEQRQGKFLEAMKRMTDAAYDMMMLWEQQDLEEKLHDPKLLEVYPRVFTLSFDEWWHELHGLREDIEKVFNRKKTYSIQFSVEVAAGMTPGEIDNNLRCILDVGQDDGEGLQAMQFAIGEIKEITNG